MKEQSDKNGVSTLQSILISLAANRCYACGWALGSCQPFNCSMRYKDDTQYLAERDGWLERQREMSAALIEATSTPSHERRSGPVDRRANDPLAPNAPYRRMAAGRRAGDAERRTALLSPPSTTPLFSDDQRKALNNLGERLRLAMNFIEEWSNWWSYALGVDDDAPMPAAEKAAAEKMAESLGARARDMVIDNRRALANVPALAVSATPCSGDARLEAVARTAAKSARSMAIEDCLNCYSPDDTATDWADKIRALNNRADGTANTNTPKDPKRE